MQSAEDPCEKVNFNFDACIVEEESCSLYFKIESTIFKVNHLCIKSIERPTSSTLGVSR